MNLPLLVVDFETRSYADIKALGSRVYALHPTTQVVCAAFAWREGEAYESLVVSPAKPGWDVPWPFGDCGPFNALAHNHYFDARVWERLGWPRPERWIDTSELARRAGMPSAKLEWLASNLLGTEKDMAGSALTKSLSKRKAAKRKRGEPIVLEGFALDPIPADVLARVEAYGGLDALLECRLFYEHFEPWDSVSPLEDAILHADRLINERGMCFDADLARAVLKLDEELAAAALASAGITDPTDVRGNDRFRAAMAALGVELADAQKATVEPLLEHPDERVAALAAARLSGNTIAGGKLKSGLLKQSPDGTIKDMLRYIGAHAQPVAEPVHTPAGWRPIGSLKPGDVVSGKAGPTLVRAVYPQGERDVFRVSFSDGTWTRCDADHLWEVTTLDGATKVLPTAGLGDLRRASGRGNYRIPLAAPVAGGGSLPLDPYTLGAFLGDGCFIGSCARFTSNDPEIAENFTFPPGVEITSRPVPGKKARHYRVSRSGATRLKPDCHPDRRLAGRGLCVPCYYKLPGPRVLLRQDEKARANPFKEAVKALGLWGCDSFTKFVPEAYMRAPAADRLALLQGLFDTDGSARSAGVAIYSSCSAALRDAVVELVQSLGGTARHRSDPLGDGEIFSVTCRLELPLFRLERKLRRHVQTPRKPNRVIVAVTPDGREECVCIQVEATDGLYLTRSFIVTHNTWRWSGANPQPQNLPKPSQSLSGAEIDALVAQAFAS